MNSWPATNHRSPSIRHDWSYLACIPKYYIIFVAMTNGIFPLIALCDFSLLVYRNARNFCVLMFILKLYYIFWLALLIFWWYLEGFLYKQSCHLQRESFIFLFNLDSFFFFFCSLISVAKTSKIKLNNNDKSGHLCLVPKFRGNAFNFSPLRIIIAVGLSYMTFIMFMYILSVPSFWRVLIIKRCWIFKKLSQHLLRWLYGSYRSIC